MVQTDASEEHYIVGIGASAGGLEALERFFSNVPEGNSLAYVVIQHLSPDFRSHMVELLSKYTTMPVYEAEDGMEVLGDAVYLIPRRKNMILFQGRLYLLDSPKERGLNLPIDIFLESLARDQGEHAVGIILSGTGSDGARGIRAIKEAGGLVMAQDDSARFDGMPRSAIATQMVDYVLPPDAMPANLLSYIRHPHVLPEGVQHTAAPESEVQIEKLFAILRDRAGVDFTDYKPNTVLRRIERRMSVQNIDSLSDYVKYLQYSPDETRVLFKEFLIGVTRFFRDTEAFDYLSKEIIPELFSNKNRQSPIRIWVPGCSTGEEAYSLAILCREYMERSGQYREVKIFATDIDREALETASRGVYQEGALADIATDRLQDYFVKRGDTYEVLRQLRSMVVFAYQNVIKDPPFSRMDLISCRNMLIYLQPGLQRKVLSTFQFALSPGGYLFLGSSESLGDTGGAYSIENVRWKVFRFQGGSRSSSPSAADGDGETPTMPALQSRPARPGEELRSVDTVLRSLVDQVMPPCVVVDDNQLVIHAFGDLDRYLTVPRGFQVDFNILKMARPEVALPLSTALHRTAHDGEGVAYRHIGIPAGDAVHYFDLSTRVFWEKANRRQLFLVIFSPSQDRDVEPIGEDRFDIGSMAQQRITHLEQELQFTRENLQATIEELETANEELQATNEELMAANEELQSTNEELQSVNEELITVNTELQFKIQELTNLNDDMANLLRSTDIGTVFLDANLRLRRFTPAAQAVINVLDQDIGRPFEHITTSLKDVDLPSLVLRVRDTLSGEEKQVQARNDRWYQLKALPYRTHTGQMGGVVLTLVDTTRLKLTEALLRDFEQAKRYLDAIGSLVVVLDAFGRVDFVNVAGAQLLGYEVNELIGVDWFELCVIPDERQKERADFHRVMNRSGENWMHHESRLLARDGGERWFAWDNTRLHNPDAGRDVLLCSGRDLTDRFTAANTALQKQDILDQSTDVIFIRDVLDRITDWGKAAERYFGYSQEEAIGRNVYGLLRTELPEPKDTIMSEFLKTGHWEGDVVYVSRDGRRLHARSRWSLQHDSHSETQSYLEIVTSLQAMPPMSSMS